MYNFFFIGCSWFDAVLYMDSGGCGDCYWYDNDPIWYGGYLCSKKIALVGGEI